MKNYIRKRKKGDSFNLQETQFNIHFRRERIPGIVFISRATVEITISLAFKTEAASLVTPTKREELV
jgi:hypothetical protein